MSRVEEEKEKKGTEHNEMKDEWSVVRVPFLFHTTHSSQD